NHLFTYRHHKIRVIAAGDDADLFVRFSLEFQLNPDLCKSHAHEVPNGGGHACGDHIVFGLRLLQDAPHGFHIVFGMSPVATGIEVAEIDLILQTQADLGDATGDLAGHEGLTPERRFVIEKDAVAGIHTISFPIVHSDPIAIKLGYRIWTTRIKWRGLTLGHGLDKTV